MRKFGLLIAAVSVLIFSACDTNVPVPVHNSLQGSWHCVENSINGTRTYLVDIDPLRTDTTQYLISNFQNITFDGLNMVNTKRTASTLTIVPNQSISNGTTTIIVKSGTGVISNAFKRIDFVYSIFDGRNDFQVQAVYTR